MVNLFFKLSSGDVLEVSGDTGVSLMEAAVQNSVPGIDAECGGACSCATCHVYIDADWNARLNPPNETEQSMVEFADDATERSRLACQIPLTSDLDGLTVEVPDSV